MADKDTQELIAVLDNLLDIFIELGSSEQDDAIITEKIGKLISIVDSYRDEGDIKEYVYKHKIRLVAQKNLTIKTILIVSD